MMHYHTALCLPVSQLSTQCKQQQQQQHVSHCTNKKYHNNNLFSPPPPPPLSATNRNNNSTIQYCYCYYCWYWYCYCYCYCVFFTIWVSVICNHPPNHQLRRQIINRQQQHSSKHNTGDWCVLGGDIVDNILCVARDLERSNWGKYVINNGAVAWK
jgi:hypothetical protein